jgi:Integrase core domain
MIIERFFRNLKEECVWQHSFVSFEHARRELSAWIRWYNEERPHQALSIRWLDSGGALHGSQDELLGPSLHGGDDRVGMCRSHLHYTATCRHVGSRFQWRCRARALTKSAATWSTRPSSPVAIPSSVAPGKRRWP